MSSEYPLLSELAMWEFPKISCTFFWGAPIIRIIVYQGLYWGPPILGNDHV